MLTKDILRFFPLNQHELLSDFLNNIEESSPRKIAQAIIENVVSANLANPQDQRQQVRNILSRLVAQLLSSVDGRFDQARHHFKEATQPLTREVLKAKILAVMVPTPKGEAAFGQVWQLLQDSVTNSLLYQGGQQDMGLLSSFNKVEQEVLDVFLDHEQRPDQLTFERALEMRRKALYAVAGLIFDVSYGHLLQHKRYPQAREQYKAAYMALQLYDDVLDIFEDMRLGIGNVLIAVAQESGEFISLQAVLSQMDSTNFSPDYTFQLVAQQAPKSYRRLALEQSTMIQATGLGGSVWNSIRIPENFDNRPMNFST